MSDFRRFRIRCDREQHPRSAVWTVYDSYTGEDRVHMFGGMSLFHATILCNAMNKGGYPEQDWMDTSLIDGMNHEKEED